jgi:hypothetical protein
MGFKFKQAETGGGDFFNVKDLAASGARVMVRPTAFVPNKNFGGHFTTDSLEADVVNLDTGTAYYQVDIKNSVPMKGLKELIGDLALVRFSFGKKQVQGNPVVLFENVTDDETVALANTYLGAHPGFETGADRAAAAEGSVDTSAPVTVPAQTAPTPDPVAQAAQAFVSAGAASGDQGANTVSAAVFAGLPPEAQQKMLASGVQVV